MVKCKFAVLILSICLVLLVSGSFAGIWPSYDSQFTCLMEEGYGLGIRVQAALDRIDTTQADYTTGRELRSLLREQRELADRAYVLWDQNPNKLSAFWYYQSVTCTELSVSATINFTERRGGATLALGAMDVGIAEMRAAVAALESAGVARNLEKLQGQ